MTTLLDGPVLAALTIAEHEYHDRAGQWLATQDSFAICPLTEAALLRFLLRLGESPSTALAVLAGIRQHPKCEFWAAALSHDELPAEAVSGADHLATAYLVALAAAQNGQLATFDESVATQFPGRTIVIPV